MTTADLERLATECDKAVKPCEFCRGYGHELEHCPLLLHISFGPPNPVSVKQRDYAKQKFYLLVGVILGIVIWVTRHL